MTQKFLEYFDRPFIAGLLCLMVFLCLPGSEQVQASEKRKIKLDITTHLGGVNTFMEGDRISFLVSLDRDAYIVVIYENARDELIQLIPNQKYPDTFLKAGLFIPLPVASAPFVFEIQPPFGKEVLWLFASDSALPELKGKNLKGGLRRLTPGIETIRNKLLLNARSAYGEAKLVLHTSAGK